MNQQQSPRRSKAELEEIARAIEEFCTNPPPEVVERLRLAAEESHRLHCPTCSGYRPVH